jgi:hypothetical protein
MEPGGTLTLDMVAKTNKCTSVHESILKTWYILYMFRPFIWPSSRRRVANDGYIEISQKFLNQCTDVNYYILKTTLGILQTTYMYNSLPSGINHNFLPVFRTLVCILIRVFFKTFYFTSVHWFANFWKISKYQSFVNAPPWEWSHEWPIHVGGILQLYFHTIKCNCRL